jgi:hypothetical protein
MGVVLVALAVVAFAAPLNAPAAGSSAQTAKARCKSKASAARKKKCKRAKPVVTNPGGGPTAPSGPTDTVPPSINIISPAAGAFTGSAGNGTFSVTGADNVICKIDGVPISCDPGAGTFSFSGLLEGERTFRIDASDLAGNTAFAFVTWNVDTSAPVITAISVTGNTTDQTVLHFSATDNGVLAESHCVLFIGGIAGPNDVCSTEKSYSGLGNGSWAIEVYGVDLAGNSGEFSVPNLTPPAQRARVEFTIP